MDPGRVGDHGGGSTGGSKVKHPIPAPVPTPALADCDDVASKLDLAFARLRAVVEKQVRLQIPRLQREIVRVAAQQVGFADVLWPILEDHPPGWLNDEEGSPGES